MRGKRSKLWNCTHNFCLFFGEELLTHHPRISGNTPSHPFKNIFASMRATKSCPPSKINRPLEIWWMVLWSLHPRQRTQPNGSYREGHPWQADYLRPPRGGCRCRWRRSKGLHFTSYSHLSASRTGGLARHSFYSCLWRERTPKADSVFRANFPIDCFKIYHLDSISAR